MVIITAIKTSLSKDSTKSFTSFVLEGGIELVQSQTTGNFYAKGKKCLLATTLTENAAKNLVGSELPGSIQRVPSDPYEYTIKETGETITLCHSYTYSPIEEGTSNSNVPFPAPFETLEELA